MTVGAVSEMAQRDRDENRELFENMIRATGVDRVWKLNQYVEKSPPSFQMDYDIAYALLATLAGAELRYALPVYINKQSFGEVFGVTKEEITEYLEWFCNIGLLRKY